MAHQVIERYSSTKGINPKSSDLTLTSEFSSGMKNAQYTDEQAVEKRKGFQGHADSQGGFGTFEYDRVDPITELETPEVLTVDDNLWKLKSSTLSITYAGVDLTCLFMLFFDVTTEEYRAQILEGANLVLDLPLGVGIDEAGPVTLDDLATAINALPTFTAVVTGVNTVAAAFLKVERLWDLVEDPFQGIARYWEKVNCPLASPLADFYSLRNTAAFENASATQLANVLYIGTGLSETFKYDGQTFYRAGLPSIVAPTSALVPAGSVTGSNYVHVAQYIQHDAAGLIIEGNYAQVAAPLNAAADSFDVTVSNILAASGFNTDCAIVDGAQLVVNDILVDDGAGGAHTMKVGDMAYFFDAVTGDYVERFVTALPDATHITVAGAAVSVADKAVISNNLRIAIYRNQTSGSAPSVFYLVAEIPNNSFTATQVFNDDLVDASLGALFIPPVTDRSPPPKGRYVSAFQNQMVLAGNPTYPRRLFWSDVDGPEYFPSDTNQEDIQTVSGQVINGIGPDGPVFGVLTLKSTHVLSGTLADNNIRIEEKSTDVGCVSHASIIQSAGVMSWWSIRGPYIMINGQNPIPLGITKEGTGRMEPILSKNGKREIEQFVPKRITSFNWTDAHKVLWFLPCETTTGGIKHSNEFSRVFAYDYTQDAWLEWTNINMMSGAAQLGDEIFFQERRYSEDTAALETNLYRFHNANDAFDYEDNTIPIDWEFATFWEAFGKAWILKKFLELKIYSQEEIPNNSFSLTVVQERDYQRDAAIATFIMEILGTGYGVSAYGTSPYGDPAVGEKRHDLARQRIKSTRMRFMNNEHQQNTLISGWEFLCDLPYLPGFKK